MKVYTKLVMITELDTGHSLVMAKVRERLTVNELTSQRFYMEMFNLKKLNQVEGKRSIALLVSK
jgi:hypothetical protein